MTTPHLPPGSLQIVKEWEALTIALDVIEGIRHPEEARQACRVVLVTRDASEDISEYGVRQAMQKIAQLPSDEPALEPPIPLEKHLEIATGLSWLQRDLRGRVQQAIVRDRVRAGGIVPHVCGLWSTAIHLAPQESEDSRNTTESKRLWQRALELSSTFGLEATDMIRWSYAAAFMPTAP